ncbi:MAG TPA: hypothetical protein ENI39_04915 [Anaerolineae bacterium]|nr:hypothetical protein [Anaerolineae bacterium]
MRRTRLMLWLAVVVGLGMCLFLFSIIIAGRADPSLAAPHQEGRSADLPCGVNPLSFVAQITCTLGTTTTDALPSGNHSFTNAAILADYTDQALVEGNPGDKVNPWEDYYRLDNAVPGWTYVVQAIPDAIGNYNFGMIAYDAAQNAILTDTNPFDGNSARVELVAGSTGPYYFKVFQYSAQCAGGTYHLEADALSPTSTPTPGPTSTSPPGPTPIPGADRFEPNYDFDHAAIIATDVTYDNLNFIPWAGGAEDNDYYKIWVKPALFFTCETLDLDPGVDTNMIFFDSNRNPLGGNDDVELGDYRSRLSYYSTYEGYLYVLVGHGGRLPLVEVEQSGYSLRCTVEVPGMSTLTPTPQPTSTPCPGTPTAPSSPLPTPTPSGELAVRPLSTPTPPPPPGTPTLHFVPVDLLVYYDTNDDRSPGAGEGVAGILVLAYDTATGEQIAQGFTDELGHLELTAAVQGTVRLSIPYLGVSQLIGSEGASIYVRIPPQALPDTIP